MEEKSTVHTRSGEASELSENPEEKQELVMIDGEAYLRSEYTVDFGPKNGCCRVEVLDPCITEEAQQKRREAILRKCEDLIRRGLM